MDPAALPFLDEHARRVEAPPERVWSGLVRALPGAFGGAGGARYARLVGCEPVAARGTFPEPGSAVVGFRVVAADPPRRLALAGRHRFAEYALTFRLEAEDGGRATRLAVESRAVFPGLHGRLYRALVLGTGAHVVAVRRVMRTVAREARQVVAAR